MNKNLVFPRAVIFTCLGLVALFLSACGDGSNSTDTNPQNNNPIPIANDPGSPAAGLDPNAFLLAHERDTLWRIDARTGKFNQLHDLGRFDFNFTGWPDVVGKTVVISSEGNTVTGFNIETGNFLWETPIGESLSRSGVSSPVCQANVCYVRGGNGVVMAVNAQNGSRIWSVSLDPAQDIEAYVDGEAPLLHQGRLYIVTYYCCIIRDLPPRVHVLNAATGAVEFEIDPQVDNLGQTIIVGDTLLIGGDDLLAYDLNTLQLRWRAGLTVATTPVVVNGVVVTHSKDPNLNTTESQIVVGLDLATGRQRWRQPAGTDQTYYTPTTDGQLVYTGYARSCGFVGCRSGYLMAINPANGALAWSRPDLLIDYTPTLANGTLFSESVNTVEIRASAGTAALDPRNGNILWINRESPTLLELPVVVNNGTVFRPTFLPPPR